MLSRVLELLQSEGWFDTSIPFETTVNLTQGACLWLLLTRHGVSDTYVKFSDCTSLQREAQRCAAATACYASLVPRFVGYAQREGIELLVCRAVDYRALNPQRVRDPQARGSVFSDLVAYFAAMPAATVPTDVATMQNSTIVATLGSYFEGHPLAMLARRWLRSDAVLRAANQPSMAQHGDLVLNNIGQTRAGAAVIFDWEDFGAACLPGLDLFTLELSLADDAARLFTGRERRADATSRLVRSACEAMHLAPDDYETLTPVYALVFRYMKRNYGPGVRERMDRLLLDLDSQRTLVDV